MSLAGILAVWFSCYSVLVPVLVPVCLSFVLVLVPVVIAPAFVVVLLVLAVLVVGVIDTCRCFNFVEGATILGSCCCCLQVTLLWFVALFNSGGERTKRVENAKKILDTSEKFIPFTSNVAPKNPPPKRILPNPIQSERQILPLKLKICCVQVLGLFLATFIGHLNSSSEKEAGGDRVSPKERQIKGSSTLRC